MKIIVSSWILLSSALALALSVVAFTQAAESTAPAAPSAETKDRPALRGPKALGPFSLFDTNHDGTLSADEIANSAAALRKLDKNSDGQITSDELRPKGPPPPREGGPDSGERRGDRQRPPEGEL